MFVRWKKRKRATKCGAPQRYSWYAEVVESVRIDGKPRQKVIAYLASIKPKDLPFAWERAYFWQRANEKLDALDLDSAERAKLDAQLAEKVRPLTEKEEANVAELRRMLSAFEAGPGRRKQTIR